MGAFRAQHGERGRVAVTRRRIDALTEREREVARLLRAGKSYRQISLALGIAENTVKTYVQRIYWKLGIQSRYALPRV